MAALILFGGKAVGIAGGESRVDVCLAVFPAQKETGRRGTFSGLIVNVLNFAAAVLDRKSVV